MAPSHRMGRKRVCRDERIWLQFGEERIWYVLD